MERQQAPSNKFPFHGNMVKLEGSVTPSVIVYYDVVTDSFTQLTQETFELILKNSALLANFKSQVMQLAEETKVKMLENAGHNTVWLERNLEAL